jgi:hypothetical protein
VTSIEGLNIWVLFDMMKKRKNEKQVVVHSVQKSTMANNAPPKKTTLVNAHG